MYVTNENERKTHKPSELLVHHINHYEFRKKITKYKSEIKCKVIIGKNNCVFKGAETWKGVDAVTCWSQSTSRSQSNDKGYINAEKYRQIIDDELRLVVAKHYPQSHFILQDDNALLNHVGIMINYKTENNIIIIL